LKQAETRTVDLLDTVQELNKKISELENMNTRLKVMKGQAEEVIEKKDRANENKPKEVSENLRKDDIKETKNKCKFENTGSCRKKSECREIHPKKTCQAFSKLGSCPLESACEHRHPFGVCYAWEKNAFCREGDNCRHRHPFEMAISKPSQDAFLGHGSPSRRQGEQGQDNHRHQGQGHHDMKGNRW
jgi:hypothetical protein